MTWAARRMATRETGPAARLSVRTWMQTTKVTSTEKVIVYTDVEAPTATDFAKVDGQELNARDLDDTKDGADKDGTPTNDWTALRVDTANVSNIVAAGFSASGSGTAKLRF